MNLSEICHSEIGWSLSASDNAVLLYFIFFSYTRVPWGLLYKWTEIKRCCNSPCHVCKYIHIPRYFYVNPSCNNIIIMILKVYPVDAGIISWKLHSAWAVTAPPTVILSRGQICNFGPKDRKCTCIISFTVHAAIRKNWVSPVKILTKYFSYTPFLRGRWPVLHHAAKAHS